LVKAHQLGQAARWLKELSVLAVGVTRAVARLLIINAGRAQSALVAQAFSILPYQMAGAAAA
jgi:hypothetical protein